MARKGINASPNKIQANYCGTSVAGHKSRLGVSAHMSKYDSPNVQQKTVNVATAKHFLFAMT